MGAAVGAEAEEAAAEITNLHITNLTTNRKIRITLDKLNTEVETGRTITMLAVPMIIVNTTPLPQLQAPWGPLQTSSTLYVTSMAKDTKHITIYKVLGTFPRLSFT